jgi:aminopeptidase
MNDPRLAKLADILVNYGVELQPGQWALIQGEIISAPLAREVYRAVLKAGGFPTMLLSDGELGEIYYTEANDAQLEFVSPLIKLAVEEADAFINLMSTRNTRAMSNIDPAKMAKSQAAGLEVNKRFGERAASGDLKWTLTRYPTHAVAQEAEMSLSEFEEFVFNATFVNLDDPVAEWRKVSAQQQRLVDWLKGKHRLTVKSAGCDLSMSIEGRGFINSDGKKNMPSGEVFTSPVEDSVNGWIKFNFPTVYMGRRVEGVELRFENGKVVESRAEKNENFLKSQLGTDPGASFLGEFALGTNKGIQRFTGDTLFDEKIGGTIHMALGRGFKEIGGQNESSVHWDMVFDMRQGGEIHVDDELFYKDGDFVV